MPQNLPTYQAPILFVISAILILYLSIPAKVFLPLMLFFRLLNNLLIKSVSFRKYTTFSFYFAFTCFSFLNFFLHSYFYFSMTFSLLCFLSLNLLFISSFSLFQPFSFFFVLICPWVICHLCFLLGCFFLCVCACM